MTIFKRATILFMWYTVRFPITIDNNFVCQQSHTVTMPQYQILLLLFWGGGLSHFIEGLQGRVEGLGGQWDQASFSRQGSPQLHSCWKDTFAFKNIITTVLCTYIPSFRCYIQFFLMTIFLKISPITLNIIKKNLNLFIRLFSVHHKNSH